MKGKQKFLKVRKGNLKRYKLKSNMLNFGNLGIKSIESGFLSKKHIEAARKILTKKVNRKLKFWVKITFNHPITSKSLGSRMGKGKGKISSWVAKIKAGTIIFEISSYNDKILHKALRLVQYKLPCKTKIVRQDLLANL